MLKGYRTYIVATTLLLVVIVEKGLGFDISGVEVGNDWLVLVLNALAAPLEAASSGLTLLMRSRRSKCGWKKRTISTPSSCPPTTSWARRSRAC